MLILIIPLISLWGYLFFKGYYFYSDQNWPLSNNLYGSGILSLNSLQGFAFSRLIIDWPYYLITLFTKSVEITERIFIYYTFVLYTFFSYVLASMITSKLLKSEDKYEIKLIKFIIVIFIFSNFTALNLNADGGSYSDGLNIIFISMILFAFVAWNNMRFAFVFSAILLTMSILVEPDYTSFYIIAILVGSVIAGVLNKDFVYRVKYAFLSIGSVVIPFLFIVYGMYITSSVGSSISTLGAIRVYNYGTIAFFSANIKPLYPLILIGHFWSTIVYAPPNILLYGDKISNVKALMQPSQLLLPAGLITDIWLFSLIMIPILSLTSITFKQTRKIVVPVFILFLIMYALSLVNYIKPIYYFEYYLSSIPIVGGSIGTTLSLPGHVINVIAGIYYILFSVTLIELFNKDVNINIRFPTRKYKDIGKSKSKISIFKKSFHISETQMRVIIVLFITFIVLFSGWEAFDGTFYPARAPDSIYGNHVGSVGGFTPMQINSSVISVYDFISAQKSDFNILWIGGPEYNNRVYEPPHPTASIPDLSYITSNNMTCNFYYNLLQSNTKYVVVSNQNIVKNAANIFEESFSDAGFKNFSRAKAFLDEVQGLNEIYSKNQVVVYQVKNFSTMYESNILIKCNANNPEYVALPYLFNSMGYKPSLTLADTGIKLQFNNNTHNAVDSPEFLFSHYTKINDTTIYSLNSNKTVFGAGHNYPKGIYDNYTLTIWSNNETYYNYSDGITDIHMTGNYNYGTSISYNGSFNNGPGGFFNNNNYVKLKVTFYAKSSVKGEDKIIFMGEPKTNIRIDNVYYGLSFNVTNNYNKYTFSYTFTNAEQYLDFRIFDYNPGTFYLKNLSVEYSTLPEIVENSSMPFGNYVVLNNTLLKGGNKTALIFIKNSTGNSYKWLKFNYSKGFCIKNKADVGALILLNNVSALNQKGNSYIVSIDPSLRNYELEYNDLSNPIE